MIGGGAAGLRAAAFAHQRGHQVTVFEKSPQLGGQLEMQAVPGSNGRWRNISNGMMRAVQDVDIRLETEATPGSPFEMAIMTL